SFKGCRGRTSRGRPRASNSPSNKWLGSMLWFNSSQVINNMDDVNGKGSHRLMFIEALLLSPDPLHPVLHAHQLSLRRERFQYKAPADAVHHWFSPGKRVSAPGTACEVRTSRAICRSAAPLKYIAAGGTCR